ncbi:MAG: Brp/Blh family beta-carotene 15,15'-dioxygenase [Sphingomicrobium sp.]
MRLGSFGFPVATPYSKDQVESPAAGPLSRPTRLLAAALVALLVLYSASASLSGTASTIAACLAILLFGLPHGTLDLEIIKRERGAGRLWIGALLLLYLGLAAAMGAVWFLAPVDALAIFMVVAVVHFAEDWPELRSKFLAQGMAIALLTTPALFHLAELEAVFTTLTGRSEGALVANLMLLLAPVSVAVASVSLWTLWRTGFHDQAMAGALALAGMTMLPPVIGFACFFCLYHSPRHLGMALSRTHIRFNARWIVPVVTLAALGIAAALFAVDVRAELPARFFAASFMTLSLLTVPHMAVPIVADALAERWSLARIRYAQATA